MTALVRGKSPSAGFPGDVLVAEGDVRDPSKMAFYARGCGTVFHLAACHDIPSRSGSLEAEYNSVNVDGTGNVLNAALKGGAARFVFFSSVKAMGEETRGCADESSPPLPQTPYGRSKLEAERLVLEGGREHDLHTVCLRPPVVYGEGNCGNVMRMIAALDSGYFPPPPRSPHLRSMVHVGNVVDAALLAAWNPSSRGKCYIVTDAKPYSTCELYESVCKALGRRVSPLRIPLAFFYMMGCLGDLLGRLPIVRIPFDSEKVRKLTANAWYSSALIQEELGFTPSVSFEQALPGLIAWSRQRRRAGPC